MDKKPPDRLLRFAVYFLLVYLFIILFMPGNDDGTNPADYAVKPGDNSYATGQLVTITADNPKDETVDAVLTLERRSSGEWQALDSVTKQVSLEAGNSEVIEYESIEASQALQTTGRYRTTLSSADGEFLAENEFEIGEPGIFRFGAQCSSNRSITAWFFF